VKKRIRIVRGQGGIATDSASGKKGCWGGYMDFTTKAAVGLIALATTGLLIIAGCAGPRWTGPGDIKRKELAPEHDTIFITSRPSGAKVLVDERVVGITPGSFDLSFRRLKHYREDFLMDGDKVLERKRVDCAMEYIPECYTIQVSKRGYEEHFLEHRGDTRDGRYSASIVLQRE